MIELNVNSLNQKLIQNLSGVLIVTLYRSRAAAKFHLLAESCKQCHVEHRD